MFIYRHLLCSSVELLLLCSVVFLQQKLTVTCRLTLALSVVGVLPSYTVGKHRTG